LGGVSSCVGLGAILRPPPTKPSQSTLPFCIALQSRHHHHHHHHHLVIIIVIITVITPVLLLSSRFSPARRAVGRQQRLGSAHQQRRQPGAHHAQPQKPQKPRGGSQGFSLSISCSFFSFFFSFSPSLSRSPLSAAHFSALGPLFLRWLRVASALQCRRLRV